MTIRDSWRRCAVESRRVRAARTARSAQDSRGDLTWRCRTAIWWRSTMISVFLSLSGRGSRVSQPHSRMKIRYSRRKVTRADRAGAAAALLLFPQDQTWSRNPSSGPDDTISGTHRHAEALRLALRQSPRPLMRCVAELIRTLIKAARGALRAPRAGASALPQPREARRAPRRPYAVQPPLISRAGRHVAEFESCRLPRRTIVPLPVTASRSLSAVASLRDRLRRNQDPASTRQGSAPIEKTGSEQD